MTDDREVWYLPPLPGSDGEGTVVYNAHPAGQCEGRACALHNPSNHWARQRPMQWLWQDGRGGRMVRLCEHGDVHEDPDDDDFRARRGMAAARSEPCQCGCPCSCRWEPPF